MTKKLKEKLTRVWRFITEEVWDLELGSLTALKSLGVRAVRVLYLIFQGFHKDECSLHASALTFSTLMSIVPILALSLALARGFGDAETAKNKIRSAVSDWTRTFSSPEMTTTNDITNGPVHTNDLAEIGDREGNDQVEPRPQSFLAVQIEEMVESGFEKVENISFKALGGFGLAMLLWMVTQVLGRVESAFNRVWGITRGRGTWRRFTDYLSVLLILPLLIIAASSVPVADYAARFLHGQSAEMVEALLVSDALKSLTVLLMTTLAFTFLVMFMPNTRVSFPAAVAGAIVTSLLFLAWMKLCAALQVGAGRYGSIYGSFAIVPIVLAWVYMSWQIVLFGAEVAFAVQNCATYQMEQNSSRASTESRVALAISIVIEAAKSMVSQTGSFESSSFARRKQIPVRFMNETVQLLVDSGFLAELSQQEGRFVLLRTPDRLQINDIARGVMQFGVKPASLGLSAMDPEVQESIDRLADGMKSGLENATVSDLLKEV